MKDSRNSLFADKFRELLDIMDCLRGDEGCPWDRKQNHQTLMPYLLEETYETLEALEEEDSGKMAEEMGDLLLQIVFHARLGKERSDFDMGSVLDSINSKLIRRHPHVFGDVEVDTADDVVKNWEMIKMKEKGSKRKSILEGIPRTLPALLQARRLQERAGDVGFDWPDISGVLEKVEEEIDELKEVLYNGNEDRDRVSDELGDILFALVNVARWLDLNPEECLRRTSGKFTRRFNYIEEFARKNNLELSGMDLDYMESLWQNAKKDEV